MNMPSEGLEALADSFAQAAAELAARNDQLTIQVREATARYAKLQQAYVYLHQRNKDLEKLMEEYLDKL